MSVKVAVCDLDQSVSMVPYCPWLEFHCPLLLFCRLLVVVLMRVGVCRVVGSQWCLVRPVPRLLVRVQAEVVEVAYV